MSNLISDIDLDDLKLGTFEESRALLIEGVIPSFVTNHRRSLYVSEQQVLTVIQRRTLRVRRLGPPTKNHRPSVITTREFRFDVETRRRFTIPAGHMIQPLPDLPDSFFIANVIDGAPEDKRKPNHVVQLRFWSSGRVKVTPYSAQGKAKVERLSPTELTVRM